MKKKSENGKPDVDQAMKLRLGCCSGIHFLEGADGICQPGAASDVCKKTRNVCCKGRKLKFRDAEKCV